MDMDKLKKQIIKDGLRRELKKRLGFVISLCNAIINDEDGGFGDPEVSRGSPKIAKAIDEIHSKVNDIIVVFEEIIKK